MTSEPSSERAPPEQPPGVLRGDSLLVVGVSVLIAESVAAFV